MVKENSYKADQKIQNKSRSKMDSKKEVLMKLYESRAYKGKGITFL